jgi:hypothetical protein
MMVFASGRQTPRLNKIQSHRKLPICIKTFSQFPQLIRAAGAVSIDDGSTVTLR